jgi:hypothetical protein
MNDLRESPRYSFPVHPERYLFPIALIACASVIVGTVIPALVAYTTRVFYERTMVDKILELSKTTSSLEKARKAVEAEEEYRHDIDLINTQLAEIAKQADKKPNGDEVQNLLRLRASLQGNLSKQKHDISVTPLFLNDLMFAWSGMYTCFGILVFVLKPKVAKEHPFGSKEVLLTILAAYLLYQSPVWVRNFVLTDEGRKVFSFANYDISRPSFFMQEANTVIWFVLLYILWRQWLKYYLDRRAYLEKSRGERIDIGTLDVISLHH